MGKYSFTVIIELLIPHAILGGLSWPSFYFVINEVKSVMIRTPLENIRNQTLTNVLQVLHSSKVQRLNNVHGLFRF